MQYTNSIFQNDFLGCTQFKCSTNLRTLFKIIAQKLDFCVENVHSIAIFIRCTVNSNRVVYWSRYSKWQTINNSLSGPLVSLLINLDFSWISLHTLFSMGKKSALGYSTTPCKKIWNNCLDLQIRPIFRFIGLSRRHLPINRSKQQNLRTISGGFGGAFWTPYAPKIIYIMLITSF